MTTSELLATLRSRDVRLWVEQGRLRCSAPAGALDAELKAAIALRKDEIIALLHHAEALKGGWSAIIPVKADGRKAPLFAVPGHNGDVFCYRALASRLDPDRPLLGVQPPGLHDGEPVRSIDELARYQVDQIRRFRPEGPYLLAGYCAGGTIAFEIARQLTEQGQEVAFLALFASPFPARYRLRAQIEILAGDLTSRMRRHLRALAAGSLADAAAYLGTRFRRARDERAARARDRHNPLLKARDRLGRATIAAIRRHRLRPYPGRVDFFHTSDDLRRRGAPHLWGTVAGSLYEHDDCGGCDADVMLQEPHVEHLAGRLHVLLDEARTPGTSGTLVRRGDGDLGAVTPSAPVARRSSTRLAQGWATKILERMDRVHLFEFNDQRWLPRFMTGWMTSVLHALHEETDDGRVWAPKVLELIRRRGQAEIVDLCSGGAGPVLGLARILEEEHGARPRLTLTDIIPNLQVAKRINEAGGDWVYLTQPINATDVPKELRGVRTVFSGFHHLKPQLAFSLLKDAFDSRRYIFIGETTKRCTSSLRLYGGGPPEYFGRVVERTRPTTAQRFFTYVVPILPLMLGWDNVVSCLRTYSDREVARFLAHLQADDYRWEAGELWNPGLRVPYPYIIGYPVSGAEAVGDPAVIAPEDRPSTRPESDGRH